ncbi:hypothetical protein BH23CHL2_BH23CHL2_08280 [soil metagenome]
MPQSLTTDHGVTTEFVGESQKRFRRAFDDAAIGMVIVAPDGRFLEINPAFCAMLGRSGSELLRSSLIEVTHPDDRAASMDEMRRALAGDVDSFTLEKRYLDRPGQTLWARVVASIARDTQGQPVYLIGQIQNITAQKQAESELRATLAKYRTLVEQIPASTYVADPADVSQILYQSPQIAQLMGYSAEEWITDPVRWQSHLHPDDRERVLEADAQANATGQPFCLEYRFLTHDGRTLWVRDEGQLVHDASGRPLCWQGITIDITAQKQTEERSRVQLALLSALTESSIDGILVVSESGQILAVNETFGQLWGIPPDQLVQAQTIDSLRPFALDQVSEPTNFLAEIERLYDAPQATSQEQITLKNGRILDRFTSPVAGPDATIYGRVWYYRDVTERVEMEQTLRRTQAQLSEAQHLAGLGSWDWDIASNKVAWSTETYRIFGVPPASVQPTFDLFMSLVQPLEREGVKQALAATLERREPYRLDITICRSDGTERVVHARGTVTTDAAGTPTRMLGTVLDITEHKALEARLAHQAQHDTPTGIPNRRMFSEHLERALTRLQTEHCQLALLFLDLDNFKGLNDRFGHDVGDAVLVTVAKRLQHALRPGEFVARLGGDEFVILLEDVQSQETASAIAQRVLTTVRMPFPVPGERSYTLSASIGVVVTNDARATVQDLLQQSDAAMYLAKTRGKASPVLDPASPTSPPARQETSA